MKKVILLIALQMPVIVFPQSYNNRWFLMNNTFVCIAHSAIRQIPTRETIFAFHSIIMCRALMVLWIGHWPDFIPIPRSTVFAIGLCSGRIGGNGAVRRFDS
jgi:hypothetical protein